MADCLGSWTALLKLSNLSSLHRTSLRIFQSKIIIHEATSTGTLSVWMYFSLRARASGLLSFDQSSSREFELVWERFLLLERIFVFSLYPFARCRLIGFDELRVCRRLWLLLRSRRPLSACPDLLRLLRVSFFSSKELFWPGCALTV